MKNIDFKKITITNFLSFGKTQEYSFDRGITLICGQNKDKADDPNGCGKSTVFDALSFALFGKTMKSLTASNLVNRIAKKNGVVQLDMEIDGKPFSIVRGVKPSFAKVIENGQEKQFAGIKPTDQYIADKIGTDYTTFRNTVMMTSNNTPPFLQQNAETKRKFIESLFNIEFVREMANLWKDENAQKMQEYKEVGLQISENTSALERFKAMQEQEKERIARDIERAKARLGDAESEYMDALREYKEKPVPKSADEAYKAWQDERVVYDEIYKRKSDANAKRRDIESNYLALSARLTSKKEALDKVNAWIDKVNAGLKERGYAEDFWTMYNNHDIYEQKVGELLQKYKDLSAEEGRIKAKIEGYEHQKSALLTSDKCPTCGHVFTAEEKADVERQAVSFDNMIEEQRKNLAAVEQEQERVKKEQEANGARLRVACAGKDKNVDNIKEESKEIVVLAGELDSRRFLMDNAKDEEEKVGNELQECSDRLNRLRAEYDSANLLVKNYESEGRHVESLKKIRDNAFEECEAAKNEKPSSDGSIKEYEDKIAELDRKSKEIEFDLEAYACAKKVLGDDGYRAELVGRIVAALNSKANEYLAKLDAPVTISVDKYFADNIVDVSTGEVVEYDSMSGGEQRRVDLAMLLAFMDIRSMQGDAKFSTLFFDEILDSALSQQACCRLMDILKSKLDGDGVNSVVITHRKELLDNDNVDNKVMITKLGGVSSVEKL